MRSIGVDLAWGGRRPSGVAVLDPDGRVVDEGWATSDDELLGFLAGHDAAGAVLALDAPLVVTNPAGTRRGCEAELQRRYGRVGAGPYPTNLRLLGGRVRAMELVARSPRPYLTVPHDPGRQAGWWAVEVFPAPALVGWSGRSGTRRGRRRGGGPGCGRWRRCWVGWPGPTRRCGWTRRGGWPASWGGWRRCEGRG